MNNNSYIQLKPQDAPNRLIHALNHCKRVAKERHLPGLTDQRFIYFIACNEYVKIGVAADVQYRLETMQIGNPYELRLLKVMESADAETEEESIHNALDQYRVRGEWFKLPPSIMAMICPPPA